MAAMAAPAVQYHHQLIEQRTDPARPNSDYDGSRAIPCRPAAGDRHCGTNDNHPSGHSGPTIGDECFDWMKFSTDLLTGQEMICSGYSENLCRGEPMTWYSAEEGAVGPSAGWADAPRVGRTGSSCSGEVPFTTGRSSDGYAVWCFGGPVRHGRQQTHVAAYRP